MKPVKLQPGKPEKKKYQNASGSIARQPRLTRSERSQKIKADLFAAAAQIVGEVGYQNAMISMITTKANVSQGTFYNYFESRQELLEQLLPEIGRELIAYIRTKTAGANGAYEREKLSFLAFFDFLKISPGFYRILYEAEVFAPQGFQEHMDKITTLYARTLRREAAEGQIKDINQEEAEIISLMLMGARHYLCMHLARKNENGTELPSSMLNTYLRILCQGIYGNRLETPAATGNPPETHRAEK